MWLVDDFGQGLPAQSTHSPRRLKRPFVSYDKHFVENSCVAIRSTSTGIFYPMVRPGSRVRQGAALGYVTDYFGKRIQEIKAPFSGLVFYITATPPISAGEPVASMGSTAAQRPR
jgi:predicted deacylase